MILPFPPDAKPDLTLHRLAASYVVEVPFQDLQKAGQMCLEPLIRQALPIDSPDDLDLVANAGLNHHFAWIHVPVLVEIFSPRSGSSGRIARLRWHARRFRWMFPVMDADLVARPIDGQHSRLLLNGRYRPPFGVVGAIFDLLVGKHFAQATADSFVESLGSAIEGTIQSGLCSVGGYEHYGNG